MPLLLTGLCEEIDEIRAFEIFNYELYEQPDAVRYLVGFGQPMDDVPPMVAPGVPTMVWGGQIRLIARGLGLVLDEIREVVERRPLERDVDESARHLRSRARRARCASRCRAGSAGKPRIVVEHVTRICDDIAPDWPNGGGRRRARRAHRRPARRSS